MPAPPFLLLFDIDGTICFKQKVHADAFAYAFHQVYGVPGGELTWVDHHGKTDLWIIDEELGKLGLTREEIDTNLSECLTAMVTYMRVHVGEDDGFLIPHVPEFLAAVRALGFFCGLVTGNLEDIAYIKLEHYNLMEYFGDSIGGFGSDHRDRAEMIWIAIQRSERLGFHFTGQNVAYIADTPLDVKAARRAGVPSIITTTGMFGRQDFIDDSPDLIVDDLSHQGEIFAFVNGLIGFTT